MKYLFVMLIVISQFAISQTRNPSKYGDVDVKTLVITSTSMNVGTEIQKSRDSIAAHNTRLKALLDSVTAHNAKLKASIDSLTNHNNRLNANKQLAADTSANHNGRINANRQLAADSVAAHLAWLKKSADSLTAHLAWLKKSSDSLAAQRQKLNALTDTTNNLRTTLAKEYMGDAYLKASGDSVSVSIANIVYGVATWTTALPHIGTLYIVNRGSYFTVFSNGDETIDDLKITYRVQK